MLDKCGQPMLLYQGRCGPLVKRLRLRPLTAATRVRVPYGSPEKTVDFDRKSTVFSTKYAFRRVKYCYAM